MPLLGSLSPGLGDLNTQRTKLSLWQNGKMLIFIDTFIYTFSKSGPNQHDITKVHFQLFLNKIDTFCHKVKTCN